MRSINATRCALSLIVRPICDRFGFSVLYSAKAKQAASSSGQLTSFAGIGRPAIDLCQ
jgi:hypothetical protein